VLADNGALGGIPLLLGAALLLVVMLRRGIEPPARLDVLIVFACALGLLRDPGVEITAVGPRVAVGLLVAAIGAVGVLAWHRPRLATGRTLAGLVAVWAAVGALVIVASPKPKIDVFELEQDGAAALLAGQNPYSIAYPNAYTPEETVRYFGDHRTELHQYPYPPLSLAVTTAGYAVARDVRWPLLAAALAMPLLLFALATSAGQAPRTAFGLAVLQLVHPRGTFVLEQAWTDGLIACAFLVLLLLIQRRSRAWLGGVALGLFLASKQYSVVLLPLLVPRRVVPRAYWPTAIAVGALVTLPMLLWNATDFIDDVVLFQLRQPARADAMSLPGLLQWSTGIRLPGALAVLAAGATIVAVLRRVVDARDLALAGACVYGVFFITAKQAFCNYYYFLGVLLLAAAAMGPRDEASPA